jgi:uncharacterized protein (UPF0261 family)
VFYDADADRALFNAVRANAEENVTVVEVDAHINDDAFADALVDTFLSQRS